MPAPARSPAQSMVSENPISAVLSAIFYIAFAAATGSLSHLTLSPVYGSIPSAAQHQRVLILAVVLAFVGKDALRQYIPPKPRRYLPALAFYVPVVQSLMFSDSTRLGAVNGPLVTECFTYFPVVLLACACISDCLDVFPIYRKAPILQVLAGVVVYFVMSYTEPCFTNTFLDLPSKSQLLASFNLNRELVTKVNLQLMTAATALAVSPSFINILAIPAVIHATQLNVHSISAHSTQILNQTLYDHKWSILARQESKTGYISVVENLEQQFRVLRCDHSMLGGEWLVTAHRRANGITVAEPIYAVFEMLEAVRLVEGPLADTPDSSKRALVIGLGVGTAPKALIAHGIQTTIIELDPVVHEYAKEYFALPSNHTIILSDAVKWVSTAYTTKNYDYILHDVFTGGAEPLGLFTSEFLSNLKSLLSTHGVIAINYAGDSSQSPTKQALHTINTVFNNRCTMYRDTPITSDPDSGFSNIVVFCVNNLSLQSKPLSFREPVEADFLSSESRKQFLSPKAELELQFPSQMEMAGEKVKLLTEDTIAGFKAQQLDSARKHWGIMRKVLPATIWEKW